MSGEGGLVYMGCVVWLLFEANYKFNILSPNQTNFSPNGPFIILSRGGGGGNLAGRTKIMPIQGGGVKSKEHFKRRSI